MTVASMIHSDPIIEYLQIYQEMRYAYGINSPCIAEFKAAIAFESESDLLPLDQRIRLQCLVRAIGHEQAGLTARAAQRCYPRASAIPII